MIDTSYEYHCCYNDYVKYKGYNPPFCIIRGDSLSDCLKNVESMLRRTINAIRPFDKGRGNHVFGGHSTIENCFHVTDAGYVGFVAILSLPSET